MFKSQLELVLKECQVLEEKLVNISAISKNMSFKILLILIQSEKNETYLDLAKEFHNLYSNFKSKYDVDNLEYEKEIEKQKQILISNEIEKISQIENSI